VIWLGWGDPKGYEKLGGRKEMQLPDGASSEAKMDSPLVKALACAFRRKRMPVSMECATSSDLARPWRGFLHKDFSHIQASLWLSEPD